jgi:hypothetical protein
VLWIRIGFNADPDPAFYLNADPDPGSQTKAIHADLNPGQTLSHKKVKFFHEKFTLSRYHTVLGQKTYLRRYKSLFEKARKPGLLINFGQFPCSWIRIRISNTDPDPGQSSECGSRWIRIHKAALHHGKKGVP